MTRDEREKAMFGLTFHGCQKLTSEDAAGILDTTIACKVPRVEVVVKYEHQSNLQN